MSLEVKDHDVCNLLLCDPTKTCIDVTVLIGDACKCKHRSIRRYVVIRGKNQGGRCSLVNLCKGYVLYCSFSFSAGLKFFKIVSWEAGVFFKLLLFFKKLAQMYPLRGPADVQLGKPLPFLHFQGTLLVVTLQQ